jgi:hypothetical protein
MKILKGSRDQVFKRIRVQVVCDGYEKKEKLPLLPMQ